jgi:hypothetical protein
MIKALGIGGFAMLGFNNLFKKWLVLTLFGGTLLAQSGCLVAAVGACAGAGGAYAYYQGNVSDNYGAEFGQVYQASKEALNDMAMPVITEKHDGLTGSIESSLSDGTKVTISLEEKPRMKPEDGHTTEVGIRVGYFGDQSVSSNMMDKIRVRVAQRMRTGPAPAATAGRPSDRLPPITPTGASVAAATPNQPNNGNWKPAAQTNGEPPKPP